jgi:hypothetical protein
MPATDTRGSASAVRVRLRPLIEGPAAWIGSDMREREAEWSYRLSPAEIAEIETAVNRARTRGLDIAEICREDFPLPTLGPVLDRLRAEVLDGRGFVLVRGLPVADRPIAESAAAYWGIGTYFGSARSQNAQGHLLGHVSDRRGEVPEGKAPFYEAPVFNEYAGHVSVLYSRLHIGSAQRFPEARRLEPEDIEALDMLAELAGDPELRLDMSFMPGDIQFLHNHTILHARSAYEDWPEVERKRHLLRLWLSPPGARPLPPVFAECYGSLTIADRGGIICKGTRLHVPLTPG